MVKQTLRQSDIAWLALLAGVLTYDIMCGEEEMLSEAADRYMMRHPWLVRAVAFALAAHVCNAVPGRLDVIHQVFVLARSVHKL